MLHPSWRTALRRLAVKLTSASRTRRRAILGRDPKLEERLAPAAFLSSRMVTGPLPAAKVRTTTPAPALLTAPDMPGLSTVSPSFAGAVVQAWQVPTTTTTAKWIVAVSPGQDPQSLFGPAFQFTPTGILPDTYVATSATSQLVSQIGNQFAGAAYYYPVVNLDVGTRLIPNDPRFPQQWHLRNTGQTGGLAGADINVTGAWDNVTGAGVTIGIIDDGLEHSHPDLQPNYSAADSFDFNGNDNDPAPADPADDHGTAVGGVASAKGNNAVGVSGSAMNASLAGLRLLGGGFGDDVSANAESHRRDIIDIYNNSWGPIDDGTLGAIGPLTLAAIQQSTLQGRGGLGNIYTWAAGNGLGSDDNVNYDGFANLRQVIAVGAINHSGKQASYSEPGAPMLVTAPSSSNNSPGITTTTTGGGYTNSFGGTSSATPVVSGVVALMLEANPNLTWRDVQHILVRTARKTDPTDAGWSKNKAGLNINHKYGFGAVNAKAAVALAENWTNVKPEELVPGTVVTVGKAIPDNGTAVSSSFNVAQSIKMEHVEIIFDATHARADDLEVVLTAPSGTKSVLATQHDSGGGFGNYSKWTFSSVRHWGELSGGKWTLTVRDKAAGEAGTFNNWQIQIYGTPGIPPVISGVETTPVSVLENKTAKVSTGITISDPNSKLLGGATVAITGNFQPGQDVLTFAGGGTITGAFDGGTGILSLTGAGTLAEYRTALRSVTYENTSDDPLALPRTITFQVADDLGDTSNKMSRIVNVIPVNDAPSFTKGPDVTVDEDSGPYPDGEFWATDISPGPEAGQTVTMEIVANSNPGLFAGSPFISSTGTLAFTPAPDVSGTATLVVRAVDSGGTANGGDNTSASVPLVITVLPVNDGPTAVADVYTTKEDGSLAVPAPGVLGNDSDPEGNPIFATKLSDPQNGTLLFFSADGSFAYTPDPDFTGQDSFTYRTSDPEFDSGPTTVTINVAPVNDSPTANDDTGASDGNPTQLNVLENDTDPDGDILRVTSYTAPTLGRITRSGNTLVYTPNPGAVGTDVFSYTMMDAGGATDTAQVTVAVTDAVAPEVRSARIKYGSASSAVLDLDSLGRSVLPWSNVTAFSFQFNEAVTADPSALTLSDAAGNALTLNFSYDAASRTATWTLPTALAVGRYSLRLDASLVTDGSSNTLASDWGKSFAILPGDYDGNGLVDNTDLNSIRANFSVVGRPVNRWADVNGDGAVNDSDLQAAQSNFGRRI
jgi:subtilisin-like proprotein convertase family protein